MARINIPFSCHTRSFRRNTSFFWLSQSEKCFHPKNSCLLESALQIVSHQLPIFANRSIKTSKLFDFPIFAVQQLLLSLLLFILFFFYKFHTLSSDVFKICKHSQRHTIFAILDLVIFLILLFASTVALSEKDIVPMTKTEQ